MTLSTLPFFWLLAGLVLGGLLTWLWMRNTTAHEAVSLLTTEASLLDQITHHSAENQRLSSAGGEQALFDFVVSEARLAARIDQIAEAIETSDTYEEAFAKAKVLPFPSREEEPSGEPDDPEPPESESIIDLIKKKAKIPESVKGKAKGVKDKVLKVANQKLQATAKSYLGDTADDS